MKAKLVYLLSFVLTLTLSAQNNCPCCSDAHQQFDFWVGEWIVLDTLGNRLGENQITWTPNEDGTVSQLWEIYDKNGNILQTAFLGIYQRVE